MKILNKTTKAIIIMLISVMMLFAIAQNKCFASESKLVDIPADEEIVQADEPVAKVAASGMGQILDAGRNFMNQGNAGDKTADYFANELAPIGSILAGVGIIIFFVVLIIMGMKWAIAKPEDKAKLKQAFVGYVIAAIVFFGAVGVWNIVRNIMENVENTL